MSLDVASGAFSVRVEGMGWRLGVETICFARDMGVYHEWM